MPPTATRPAVRTHLRVLRPNPAIPWYLWCAALAVTSAYIGGYWDISWHRSIGRDSFWSPPHIAIYGCGVLAGLSSAYLILTTTLGAHAPLRPVSVGIWGLRGPLGAFISAWGGLAMLVSAPFDNWWHNAYGLDVRIVSPPHMVLAAGFFGINFGTVLLMQAFVNRAEIAARRSLRRLLLYVGGMAVCESLLLKIEYISRSQMHSAAFYAVTVSGTLGIVTALAIASRHRWGATILTSVYALFSVAFLWILPLFPAEPKLGPVYSPVTHFVPWEFPLLIMIPALVTDLILQRTAAWRPLARAPVTGLAFLGTFIVVQWPFAYFLMSPLARNWVFGAGYWDFNTLPSSPYARFEFLPPDTPPQFARGMLIAVLIACAMTYVGLHLGRVLQRVKR
ncbi:MAG: hypothetical protein ABJA98_17895 [Acidobacteriota bacterium]